VDVNKTVVNSLAIGRKHEAIAESTVEISSQDIGVIRAYCCQGRSQDFSKGGLKLRKQKP